MLSAKVQYRFLPGGHGWVEEEEEESHCKTCRYADTVHRRDGNSTRHATGTCGKAIGPGSLALTLSVDRARRCCVPRFLIRARRRGWPPSHMPSAALFTCDNTAARPLHMLHLLRSSRPMQQTTASLSLQRQPSSPSPHLAISTRRRLRT